MSRPGSRSAPLACTLAAVLAACQQGGAPTTGPAVPTTRPAPSAATSVAPTALPEPTRLSPTADVPAGYRRGTTVPFSLGLVADGVLISANGDTGIVTRWDAATFEELGQEEYPNVEGQAPNLQSITTGAEGVWITLAVEHAVGLIDPRTGELRRKVTVYGSPYDTVEVDGELWIADFGWGLITRYDLRADRELAVIRALQGPTDVIFADGAIWAPSHIGRVSEDEPITAGGYLRRIDPATNSVVASPKVGPRPYYLAAGFGGVWTGTATGGAVERVDTATGEVTAIPIGEDGAFDIEVMGDSVWAVVGPQWPIERRCDPTTSYFVRIDPATRQVRELVAFPCATAITPAENGFWVSGNDGMETLSTFFESVD